jgi:hypothetical protein
MQQRRIKGAGLRVHRATTTSTGISDCLHDPPGGDHSWGDAVRGDPEWPEIR